jgi:deoxyribodipyrimidine photolyase-like uncharacterized protein
MSTLKSLTALLMQAKSKPSGTKWNFRDKNLLHAVL